MKTLFILFILLASWSSPSYAIKLPKNLNPKTASTEPKKKVFVDGWEWACEKIDIGCRIMVVCGSPDHRAERALELQTTLNDVYCP